MYIQIYVYQCMFLTTKLMYKQDYMTNILLSLYETKHIR